MFAVPSFFGYNTTFVNGPVATAATGVGETSFTANWNAFTGATYYLLDVSTSPSFSSFVLQDEVVIAPTTSYVVIGLTGSTTYYYRLRASTDPYIDPDASAFFARVTAAGGTLSATEQTATNQLVLDMKAAGIWTSMKAVYPMVGASAAACAQNLKSSSFTGIFNGGVTYASAGVTFNGATGYLNSQLNASTNFSVTSLSFGGYTSGTLDSLGYHGAYPPNYLMHSFRSYNFTEFFRTTGSAISVSGGTVGMVQANQLGTTSKIYANNSVGASGSATMTTLPNTNMYVGAVSNNGTASLYDLRLVSYYYYSDGLTDTQLSNHYTAVQAFQTTLSRNV